MDELEKDWIELEKELDKFQVILNKLFMIQLP
jgi:hypothetical protein